ncbi:helix-turn-helix transcriptional regulator [Maribacter sp. 1_MG-2023]|uniref:helix-turn-helix domain-containing protein n=1 Tax=Maribacter sp. 1_MG-2023 TaxID=3062677 RepID=UPI0026E3C96A|nr:helix-turn-helix transcriptional regulator [Maribacter sp. 1_MG-2023]MDO6473570.1 helix-turn-helix transcriptional regulator [Maribacter sp. 1_MG-2023]
MFRTVFLILILFSCFKGLSQYSFEGQIADEQSGKTIYLSIIEDYRKFGRISMEQILKKTTTDSLGYFSFRGNNLNDDNRIYRIHLDDCSDASSNSEHFFGSCEFSKSILFIANNNDTITFPTSFANEVLCEIASTNSKSSSFLDIDVLKEEMAFDFNDFRSDANRKLNSKKWFSTLQDFGEDIDEPLAELYIFNFLSDKRHDTYSYYLKNISKTNYYNELGERLLSKYPNAPFTDLYLNEIAIDQQLIDDNSPKSNFWKWLLLALLLISISLNVYFVFNQRSTSRNLQNDSLAKLTEQEHNIVQQILDNKTNKEIAAAMFISVSTVKTHINNVYKKLEVSSRDEIKQRFQ